VRFARQSLELAARPCRAARGAHLHMVGSRFRVTPPGVLLAGLHHRVTLGEAPFAQFGSKVALDELLKWREFPIWIAPLI